MLTKRTSGILLHLTSLPGKHGIGDLGPDAYKFIDFLAASGQSCWQFLPTGPTSTAFDSSPYMCRSVFAGNPLLINLDLLVKDKYLSAGDLEDGFIFSEYNVDYQKVTTCKNAALIKAFNNFKRTDHSSDFKLFCQKHDHWLTDYALFMSFREIFDSAPWYEWPDNFARRDTKALAQFSTQHAEKLLYYRFVQFVFFTQWQKVYNYAHAKNISLIGDIPIYVALDSADVWSNQELFKIDPKTMQPVKVAGVPPDYFSETGQRWGNPVYRWKTAKGKVNKKLNDWWLKRFRLIFSMMDMVKIDHFRGFEAFWEIPAHEQTAINGKWVKGPGKSFFTHIKTKLNKLPIIAEDLGVITPAVEKIRDQLGFPGMRVLQFAFESDEKNPYLPHNYEQRNTIVYTGTHDNNTTLGWFMGNKLSEDTRDRIRRYLNSYDDSRISWEFTRLAMSSIAALAIIPLQDILGFGEDCQMNRPGTQSGNWRWRCAPDFLNTEVEQSLRDITIFYNRLP
ncbi:MAG: 4-alpha-glucanotransferase [Desulfobacterales bacterium SG8_35_2]|nr:MAG: 4-alpha-glucanotransferase [Desulfobacterales bacterium SG8_35_2]